MKVWFRWGLFVALWRGHTLFQKVHTSCLKVLNASKLTSLFSLLSISPSWLEVTFCPSALSLSFYRLCEGGGHRKITIIIEDPVAGWQCSSTVLHHYIPPLFPFFFFFCSACWWTLSIPLISNLAFSSSYIFFCSLMFFKLFWFVLLRTYWCDEAMTAFSVSFCSCTHLSWLNSVLLKILWKLYVNCV